MLLARRAALATRFARSFSAPGPGDAVTHPHVDPAGHYVQLSGLPALATRSEIAAFAGCTPADVIPVYTRSMRPGDFVFARLPTVEARDAAVARSGRPLAGSSHAAQANVTTAAYVASRLHSSAARHAAATHAGTAGVIVAGLPAEADESDVLRFFDGYDLLPRAVMRVTAATDSGVRDSGVRDSETGERERVAVVAFASAAEAHRACLEKHLQFVRATRVTVKCA